MNFFNKIIILLYNYKINTQNHVKFEKITYKNKGLQTIVDLKMRVL